MKEEKFIIEDLVSLAINNANKKVDIEVNNKMTDLMQDMGIPNNLISMLPFINSK
jgi:DNA-binding protein YbaB